MTDNTPPSDTTTRLEVQKCFPNLFTRQGRCKTFQARFTFVPDYRQTHQKGRRIPLQLQPKFEAELERLQRNGYIERLQNWDRSPKLAINVKKINSEIQEKNKYPMQNIDELLEQISRIATNPTSPGATWFATLDLKHAYGQQPLDCKQWSMPL